MLLAASSSVPSLSAGFANTSSMKEMEAILTGELTSAGVTGVDYSKLTYAQIADLSAVFDQKGSSADYKAAVEAILQAPQRMAMEARSIRDDPQSKELASIVQNDLTSIGIKGVNTEALSLGEVQQIAAVFDAKGTPDAAAVHAILNAKPRMAVEMKTVTDFPAATEMEKIVVSDIASLGIKVAHPKMLTLEQMSQISAVLDQHESTADRTAAIKLLLGIS